MCCDERWSSAEGYWFLETFIGCWLICVINLADKRLCGLSDKPLQDFPPDKDP